MELIYAVLILTYVSFASSGVYLSETEAFAQAAKSRCFSDNTLFIKSFLNKNEDHNQPLFVSAPSQFGKTTIIDMITAFFGNNSPDIQNNNDTFESIPNYDLFCGGGKNLNICKEKGFIKEHMGQYPIVQINYIALRFTTTYKNMLNVMKEIYRKSYDMHEDMFRDEEFMKSDELNAVKETRKTLYESEPAWNKRSDKDKNFFLRYAIPELLEALNSWSGKKVILLTDEYDAFCQPLIYKSVPEKESSKIIGLMQNINVIIYKSYTKYIRRALITGILLATDMGMLPVKVNEIRYHEGHEIASYYRLSEGEVETLVRKMTKQNADKICKYLRKRYDGYHVAGLNDVTFYNNRPVFAYLDQIDDKSSFVHVVITPSSQLHKLIRDVCRSTSFINVLEQLVNYEKITAGFKVLSIPVLKTISNVGHALRNNPSKSEHGNHERFQTDITPYMFSFMIYTGCLTYIRRSKYEIDVLIPNQQIREQFRDILNEYYFDQYKHLLLGTGKEQEELLNSFERLTKFTLTSENFENIYEAFQTFLTKANRTMSYEIELQFLVACAFLRDYKSYNYMEVRTRMSKDYGKTMSGRIDIYFRNHNEITIVIELKIVNSDQDREKCALEKKGDKGMDQIYEVYHNYIFNRTLEDEFKQDNETTGVLYISLAYNVNTRHIQTVFSVPNFHNGGTEEDKTKRVYFPTKSAVA